MKKINFKQILTIIFIAFIFLGCEELGIKPDGCDSSVLKTQYRITANSNEIVGEVSINQTKYSPHQLQYKVTYTKVRCGGKTTTYYSSPMYSINAKMLAKTEFSRPVSCSTEYRNSEDYILVEFTAHLVDISGNILASKIATNKYTYNDVDHAAHNGSMNLVPNFIIKF